MFDIVTIGSATVDAFVETNVAEVLSINSVLNKKEFILYPYGSKIEVDAFKYCSGGGAVNTAANFSNLGCKTTIVTKVGDDINGKIVLATLDEFKVDKTNITITNADTTGFSVILISFQGDRTVLTHRGASSTILESEINYDAIKQAKWLYVAPLNGYSTKVLDGLASFAEENGINMAINVGTSSIKKGVAHLSKVLRTAEVVILNKEEASMLTEINVRPDSNEYKFSEELIHTDIKKMLNKLKSTRAKIVVITDGKSGVYAFDGNKYYQAKPFPAKVLSTLGAGDAFASTFVASLDKTNWNIELSLKYASVNSAAIVEKFGAQEGFLTFEQIEQKINDNPDFLINVL